MSSARLARLVSLRAAIPIVALVTACSVVIAGPGLFIIIGDWGGEHVRMELEEAGGTLEYDCAHGTIDPGWMLTDDGEFTGTGEHVIEHGGPIQEGEVLPARPASYDGTVDGDLMSLTVTLSDSAQVIGTFLLQRDSDGNLFRCL